MHKSVFRIEQMLSGKPPRGTTNPLARRSEDPRVSRPVARPVSSSDNRAAQDLKHDVEMINRAIDRSKHELAALHGAPGEDSRIARARHELGSAIANMEKATQQILKAAETIDESARALHATLKNDYNRGLSQDIADHVVRIYEACNFQDLSGQHISKAIDTLKFVEDHVTRMTGIWGDVRASDGQATPDQRPLGRTLANGPKVEGDTGHVDQRDIDNIFGCA